MNKEKRFSDFSHQNLTGTDFSNHDLTGCDFSNAILTDCNFLNSRLTGCKFTKATVWDANFQNCDFSKCDFRGCIGLTVMDCSGFWPTEDFQYILEFDVVVYGSTWTIFPEFKTYRSVSKTSLSNVGWPKKEFWSVLDKLRQWYIKTHKLDRIHRDDRKLPRVYIRQEYEEIIRDTDNYRNKTNR